MTPEREGVATHPKSMAVITAHTASLAQRERLMRWDGTDPETGHTVAHLEGHPFIIEDTGQDAPWRTLNPRNTGCDIGRSPWGTSREIGAKPN